MRHATSLVIATGIVALLLAGSGAIAAPESGKAIVAGPAPTWAELANARYSGFGSKGPVTLADGRWEGRPFVAGGASAPALRLSEGFHLSGDLDGDGADEAVVHLTFSGGGTGSFGYLAVMGRRGDRIVQKAIGPIGDRVQIRGARIDGGAVVLEVLQPGPTDAMCCPSQLATRTLRLRKGKLAETASTPTGTASLATLEGREWILRSPAAGSKDDPAPAITLVVNGSTVAGTAGCNRYTGGVRPGATATGLAIGALASTRMACAPDVMQREQAYLDALQKATAWRFDAGRLALDWNADAGFGSLVFEGRPAAGP